MSKKGLLPVQPDIWPLEVCPECYSNKITHPKWCVPSIRLFVKWFPPVRCKHLAAHCHQKCRDCDYQWVFYIKINSV